MRSQLKHMGWLSMGNGDLLAAASEDGFDVLDHQGQEH